MPRSRPSPSSRPIETARAVLAATIDAWTGKLQQTRGLGAIDEPGWTASIPLLNELKMLAKPVTTEELVRSDLLPAGD